MRNNPAMQKTTTRMFLPINTFILFYLLMKLYIGKIQCLFSEFDISNKQVRHISTQALYNRMLLVS
jgi:hypothetical protein